MCCVIPPASPAAIFDSRIASRRDVLPWSTCPMIVTTGSRGRRSAVTASRFCSRETSSSNEMTFASKPNSRQTSLATLISRGWLIVAMMPRPRSFVMMSLALRSIFSDSSLTVTPSVTVISCRISGTGTGAAGRATGGGTACGRVAWAAAGAGASADGDAGRFAVSPRRTGRRGACAAPGRAGTAAFAPAEVAGECALAPLGGNGRCACPAPDRGLPVKEAGLRPVGPGDPVGRVVGSAGDTGRDGG